MKKIILGILCVLCLLGAGFTKAEAAERIPVAFVCMDSTGNMTQQYYLDFKRQVRQGYYPPRYEFFDGADIQTEADKVLAASGQPVDKLSIEVLRAVADATKAQVVALMFISSMEEVQLTPSGGMMGPMWEIEDLTRVYAYADMYVYKTNGDKFMCKHLHYTDTNSTPVITPAHTVIQWELRKLVNKMEGREQI